MRDGEKPLLLDVGRREATAAGRGGVNLLRESTAAGRGTCYWTWDGVEKPLLHRGGAKPLLLLDGRQGTTAAGRDGEKQLLHDRGGEKPLLLDAGRREATATGRAARNHCCWTGRRENTASGRSRAWNHCCWTQDVKKPLLLDRGGEKPLLLNGRQGTTAAGRDGVNLLLLDAAGLGTIAAGCMMSKSHSCWIGTA